MNTTSQYYTILEQVDELSDDELVALSKYVKEMIAARERMKNYDPAKDQTVGFLSGPTDLSVRAKEILRDEITSRSGWTQKKD